MLTNSISCVISNSPSPARLFSSNSETVVSTLATFGFENIDDLCLTTITTGASGAEIDLETYQAGLEHSIKWSDIQGQCFVPFRRYTFLIYLCFSNLIVDLYFNVQVRQFAMKAWLPLYFLCS